MWKKLLSISVAAICIMSTYAHANQGDIVHSIYSTDILTLVDGRPIESYNIGGQTMIALEDLSDYGFTVNYDDSARLLIVNKTHEADTDFATKIERNHPGRITGSTYESDISAMVNGNYIETESLDGKLAATVEQLGYSGIFDDYGIKQTQYHMEFDYNDSTRTLSLTTHPESALSYEEQINGLVNYENMVGNYSHTLIKCNDFDVVLLNQDEGGTVRNHLLLFYPNGHVINMSNILTHDSAYAFGSFPYATIFNGKLSDDKKQFIFYGERYKTVGMHSDELVESGNYYMMIPEGIVRPITK